MEEFEVPEKPESGRDRVVGLIIASIAVVLAIVTALGHQLHDEEILAHIDASDQYAFYQAKKERSLSYQLNSDALRLNPASSASASTAELLARYEVEQKRLETDAKEIQKEGDGFVKEARRLAYRAGVLDLGEIALQISVVLCSITILTEQRLFVRMGVIVAGIGVVISIWGMIA